MFTLTTQAQEIKLESLSEGPGILPFRLGPMNLISHYHTFIQFTDLSLIENNISTVRTQITETANRLKNETFWLFETQVEYLNYKLDKALDQLKTLEPTRKKRGLVDGLGSIIKSITGNLDQTDANNYNKAIQILQENQDKSILEYNNHISLNKEWMSYHDQIVSQIVENQAKLNETLHLVLTSTIYTGKLMLKVAEIDQLLTIINDNIDALALELSRIENILAFTRASSVHHSMLGINTLSSMLKTLRNIYDKDQIIDLDLREYYDIIVPGSYYARNRIVFIFKFPIVSPQTYELFKLPILPNKFNQALIPPHPIIATHDKSYVYIEAECPKLTTRRYLCDNKLHQQMKTEPDCIQRLIMDQVLDKTCHYVTVSLTKEALEQLDDRHYAIIFPEPTKVQLTCDRDDYNTLNGSYLITIPHNCKLRTKEFTLINTNDHIEGQPLRIVNLQTYMEPASTASRTIVPLNSINLKGLDIIHEKIATQKPITLKKQEVNLIYHTTIPFYVITSGLCALALAFACRRYLRKRQQHEIQQAEDDVTPAQDNQPRGPAVTPRVTTNIPATFFLNLKK